MYTVLLSHNIAIEEQSLSLLSQTYPQLKTAYAFRWLSNGAVSVHSIKAQTNHKIESELASFIQQSNTGWYAKSETPIDYKKSLGQVELEHELERCLLIIRSIEYKDLQLSFLLEFSPFGLSTSNYLSSAEKRLLESSIKNLMNAFVQIQLTDKEILKSLAKSKKQLHNELLNVNERLENRDQHFERTLNQLMQLLLGKLQRQLKIKINYHPSFSKALYRYNGSFEDLETHLAKQLEVDANLAMLNDEEEIWLDESHMSGININKSAQISGKAEPKIKLGRLAKAYALLDRYESSANKLVANGLSIIGKNIGLHCQPAISNAAITDALSKNSKKIYELFEKYPDRWPVIRNQFKSIANIIEKESIRRQTA